MALSGRCLPLFGRSAEEAFRADGNRGRCGVAPDPDGLVSATSNLPGGGGSVSREGRWK